jgi:phosphoglycerate kinase
MLSINDLNVKGKTVFLRLDLNVPLDETGRIRDDTRLRAALPTIKYLMENGSKIIITSHLGRPKGTFDPQFSLKPVADRLNELVSREVILAPEVVGEAVDKIKNSLTDKQILLLENLRFHPGEKQNDGDFARELGRGIDVYVNDAFGACHRKHASVVAVASLVPLAAAGFLIQKEIDFLNQAVSGSKKPYVAILGGAKVSDKIPVIRSLLHLADSVLIGGAMAYTFFYSQGLKTGRSLVEKDMKELALELIREANEKMVNLYLPLDHLVAPNMNEERKIKVVEGFPIPSGLMALDIGPQTIERYSQIIDRAKTIFWNGPMGVFERDPFSEGTVKIAQAVAESRALSIAGGGDSVAAIIKAGVADRISHISTGGGASLEYIARGTLPGIEALTEKQHVDIK